MKNIRLNRILLVSSLLLTPVLANAESAEEKGLAIAVEADKRDTGFEDFNAS